MPVTTRRQSAAAAARRRSPSPARRGIAGGGGTTKASAGAGDDTPSAHVLAILERYGVWNGFPDYTAWQTIRAVADADPRVREASLKVVPHARATPLERLAHAIEEYFKEEDARYTMMEGASPRSHLGNILDQYEAIRGFNARGMTDAQRWDRVAKDREVLLEGALVPRHDASDGTASHLVRSLRRWLAVQHAALEARTDRVRDDFLRTFDKNLPKELENVPIAISFDRDPSTTGRRPLFKMRYGTGTPYPAAAEARAAT